MLRYGLVRLQPEIGGACRKLIERCSSHVRRRLSTSPGTKESSSFMMNMFLGRIKPDEVFPYPEVLNADDVELIQSFSDSSHNLFKEIDSVKLDEQGFLDDETLEKLRNSGSWGVQVPVEYGGMGLNNTQLIKMAETSGNNDVGIAIILGAHQGIGLKGIVLFGTEEQKNKYLPDLSSGKKIAAFALTEPSSGSDANSIRSKAVLSGDGTHYILNGSKLYISNGDIADVMTVFAQVPITDPKTGTTKNKVTAFIVERAFGGVTSGPREKKLGIRVSGTTEVFFDDVKIPKENVLGGEGAGFKIAMHILNAGRFAMAGTMSGIIQKCLSKVVGQVSTRSQFGRTLDSFGIIQEKVARMVIQHYVVQSMAYALAGSMDRGAKEYQIEAAIGKVYASEAAWDAVDESIQLFGGSGYMKSTGLEKILRDVRIFRIFEGTNEILRLLVALTGIQYAGGHLKELQSALKNPAANLGVIFGEGSKRALRMVGVNRSSQSLDSLVHPELNEEAKLLCRSVERFGMTIEDILKRYGKHVIEEQFLLFRVANVAMENYAMAVTLSRATRSLHTNAGSAQHELDICKVFCYESERKTERLLEEVRKGSKMEAIYPKLTTISKNFVANAGIIYTDPLGCH